MTTPSVLFSELFQPTFSTQLLIPISIVTDSISLSYSPGISASGSQLLTLFALASHVNRTIFDTPKRVIALGNHSTLFAKILLNLSTSYVVDVVVKSQAEQDSANAYINSPNLFKSYFFGPIIDTTKFAVFDQYDIVVFTDTCELKVFPIDHLPTEIEIVTPIEQTKDTITAFDAHDVVADILTVTHICTLATGHDKLFTISGVKK